MAFYSVCAHSDCFTNNSHRRERLQAAKNRYDKKAEAEDRKRRPKGPTLAPIPPCVAHSFYLTSFTNILLRHIRVIDEKLINRSLRRMRTIDAELRSASNNSLVGWAKSLCNEFDTNLNYDEVRETLTIYEGQLHREINICQEELEKIRKEGGITHGSYHDGAHMRSHLETMYGYVLDIGAHADKGDLHAAKQQRTLLYQRS